jgi:uncharacterized protein (DUF58 family)
MIAPSLHPRSMRAVCRPRSRFAFGLTPRAIVLLAVGLLLALPGFFDGRLAYAMVAWDALVFAAIVFDALRLPAPSQITVERSWSNAPSLDSETQIELAVEFTGGPILECRMVDDLPGDLLLEPATHPLRAYPNIRAVLRYTFTPRERGDTNTGGLYLRYTSLLKLVERWAMAPVEQAVRVYPALRRGEDQQIFLARSRQADLQLRQMRQRGLGRDFESLREYREGDDLRDVCWTATARRGQLITRQFQTERSQTVWIVLDAGRLLRGRITSDPSSGRVSHTKLDYGCSSAVSLAQLVLSSGDRAALLVYGQTVQQRVLPGRGAAHMRQIVESLAQARAEASEADHLRAAAVLGRLQPRRSLILWITDLAESAIRPEVIDGALQLLRRHLLLFVAIGQPDVEIIAGTRPKNEAEMFRASAAQELIGRRERLLARLQEQGAFTFDLNPERLTSAVLNQYLAVKEKALL